MSFVERIWNHLAQHPASPCIEEVQENQKTTYTCDQMIHLVQQVRQCLLDHHVKPGDRVALLAPNSAYWIACDIGILAHGAICVPLYSRQEPKELAFMLQDSDPVLCMTSSQELGNSVKEKCKQPPCMILFEQVFQAKGSQEPLYRLHSCDPVTIIYTSGTGGAPKGAILSEGNISYMLEQTSSRLNLALGSGRSQSLNRVFHFLPLCFAGSRIMLFTQLVQGNFLFLSTDLTKLAQEISFVDPHYYLNVPAVLERVRVGVNDKLKQRNGWTYALYKKGQQVFLRKQTGTITWNEKILLLLARWIVFQTIKKRLGKSLRFLICGSAALAQDTQYWFQMLGIPVLQVYGLTETTAILTMDHPDQVETGFVGHVIEGCEIAVSPEGELLCKGPNVFQGYWKRPEETVQVLKNGWLHTGDQVEINHRHNLRVVGRMKNILIPQSGHNVIPEPIEQDLIQECEGIEHAVLIGHGRPFLSVIVTGQTDQPSIAAAIERINQTLPHYRKIQMFYYAQERLTAEKGLLTANQKLRRKAIEKYFEKPIEELYHSAAKTL